MRTLALFMLALLTGCPSGVLEEYEQAKGAALTDPGPAPAHWNPDAVVSISDQLLDELLAEALREDGALSEAVPIKGPLGVRGTVTPDLTVDSLQLAPSKGCASCVAVDAALSGDVSWTLGPARGTFPLTATIGLDTEIDAVRNEEGTWEIRAIPQDVRQADVDFGGGGAKVSGLAEGPVKEWLREALDERKQALVVARIDGEELPLRALRVKPHEAGVRIEMLTTAPELQTAKPSSAMPEEGWRLEIAPGSLLAIAKRASFEAGPVSHDVVIEPTHISLNSDGFDMDMRLWRIKGKGWWRDYHTEGALAVDGRRIALTPETVEERGKSAGAVLVDPLAALGHGVILKAIEDSLETSVPGIHRASAGKRTTEVRIREIDGTGAMVRVTGTLVFKEPKKPTKTRSKKRR